MVDDYITPAILIAMVVFLTTMKVVFYCETFIFNKGGEEMYGKDSATELWAILNEDGSVNWSRGGSSTKPHLMVYPSEEAARKALKSPWTKQVIKSDEAIRVECIYRAGCTD